MPSYYSVVQYVPDPVADERINVGVIVFGDGVVRSRFLRSWRRVQALSGTDVTFLREFVGAVATWAPEQRDLPGIAEVREVTGSALRAMAGHWINSIQFSEPRASLAAPDAVMADIAARFLKEPTPRRRGFRDRRAAAQAAYIQLRAALQQVAGPQTHAVLARYVKVAGRFDEHRFDISVQNGRTILAAQGLSFEVPASRELEKEVDAVAWAIDDVHRAAESPALAVVALPPKSRSRVFDRAVNVFRGLGATVVQEDEIGAWATDTAMALIQTPR
jgi:Protein of unknown function (DUF3037)